mmetsp:Transcript_24986/g.40131  ORF Transcript_24986/g.40131 Transcript_24986/m.40131 type:complete len:321 (-) Transcript_24986:114-1076(-)
MGQNCCVKDVSSTTEAQVSYIGSAEGTVVPVPKLRNPDGLKQNPHVSPDVDPELFKPEAKLEEDTYVVAPPAENGTAKDDVEVLKVDSSVNEDVVVSSSNEFEHIAGTWYFVANGKEAGMIKADGFLTFHNGMTGQLCKAPGKSNAFTLTTQPDATIEIVRGYEDQEQLHWTDGNFSASWARSRPQAYGDYSGIWTRKNDGKTMARITGSGLVEWLHNGGQLNTKSPKRASLLTGSNSRTSEATSPDVGESEVEPRAVFQLEAMPQRSAKGELVFKMKSVSGSQVFIVVVTSRTELKFETPPLQGLIWTRKMSTDVDGGV